MKTRIQLTGYSKGKYILGQADNFVIPDILAETVHAAIEPIKTIADRKHKDGVEAGTVLKRGGPKVRVQLTEYSSKDGKYLCQNGTKVYNFSIPDLPVSTVADLVDYQLAINFGIRRKDAANLVKIWNSFVSEVSIVPEIALDGYGKALMLPDLLGKLYNKKLHLGKFCVVTESLHVFSIWEKESDAIISARRAGNRARVVDALGFLVPQSEMEVPEVTLDRW